MRINKLHFRLRAYSIIEVIVALIILLFLFFIAISFFVTVNKTGFDIQKLNAGNALNEYMLLTKINKTFFTDKAIINGWNISREVHAYPGTDSIVKITYTVYGKDSAASPLLIKNIIEYTATE